MGKIVVTELVSLDGVFEAPGGGDGFEHAGWTFKFDRGDEGNHFKLDELMAADAQLLGRVTYERLCQGLAVNERHSGLCRQDEQHAEIRRVNDVD